MDYMAKDPQTRSDIRRWWPQARSVFICAFDYADNRKKPLPEGHGRVARYAGERDYHLVLREKMKSLSSFLKTLNPEADSKIFVDTSPILERLYGRYAGLGWIGKNTMLLSKKGSYFFLSGMAINIDLPPDSLETDHCGNCRRCLDACPTQAFPQERVLDASKCISYWTIEHKGEIPPRQQASIGEWVFGCDICQEVCPFNRFASFGKTFQSPGYESLPLKEIEAESESEFNSRFKKTALARSKRSGLSRNARIVLENTEKRFQ